MLAQFSRQDISSYSEAAKSGTEAEFIDKITTDVAALLVSSPTHMWSCDPYPCSCVHLLLKDFVLSELSKLKLYIEVYKNRSASILLSMLISVAIALIHLLGCS